MEDIDSMHSNLFTNNIRFSYDSQTKIGCCPSQNDKKVNQ